MVTSGKSPLINVYGFFTSPERPRDPSSWKGSFMLAPELGSGQVRSFLSLCLCPASLIFDPGAQRKHSDIDLRFLHVWGLTPDLALCSSICIAHKAMPEELRLPKFLATQPELKLNFYRPRRGPEQQQDFVVANCLGDTDTHVTAPGFIRRDRQAEVAKMKQKDLRLRIDWKRIFNTVFPQAGSAYPQATPQLETLTEPPMITELLANMHDSLQRARHADSLTSNTL